MVQLWPTLASVSDTAPLANAPETTAEAFNEFPEPPIVTELCEQYAPHSAGVAPTKQVASKMFRRTPFTESARKVNSRPPQLTTKVMLPFAELSTTALARTILSSNEAPTGRETISNEAAPALLWFKVAVSMTESKPGKP